MNFYELDLEDEVLNGLDAMNFFTATPVQEATIPVILQGRDLMACAQTGTGKTAAYILPLLNKLTRGEMAEHAINAIVMAPTRELAQQIDQQVEGFSYFLPVSAVAVYGGTDGIQWEQQKRSMAMGADIVIATPGRLLSMLQLCEVNISEVSYFVLDEADRMLDMGFFDDIMQIVKQLPKSCQVLMFSATMPPKIKKLGASILKDPIYVELAISRPPSSIRQEAYVCHEAQKLPLIKWLFTQEEPKRTIVFTSSKLKTKEIRAELQRAGVNATEMHSDLDQAMREQVMKDFRSGVVDVLVATDIVARGIDIDDIEMVINFDPPRDPEDYVHRIGRTARGTRNDGRALTFISKTEQYDFGKIEQFLGYEVTKLPIPALLGSGPEYAPEKSARSHGAGGRKVSKAGRSKSGGTKNGGQNSSNRRRSESSTLGHKSDSKGGARKSKRRALRNGREVQPATDGASDSIKVGIEEVFSSGKRVFRPRKQRLKESDENEAS